MTTYLLHDAEALGVEFYRGYDPDFLLAHARTLMFVTEKWDDFRKFGEGIGFGVGERPEKARSAMRAHVRFVEYQQFESCFALLLAKFQALPHWLFLTTYETRDLLKWAKLFLEGDFKALAGAAADTATGFLELGIYDGRRPADAHAVDAWSTHLQAIHRFLRAAAERYLRATVRGGEYNAYKHGLRVLTGHSELRVGFREDLSDQTPVAASPDSLTFLEVEQESPGRKTVAQVTRHFSPEQSLQYLYCLRDLADMMKKSRLATLTGASDFVPPSLEQFDPRELDRMATVFEIRIGR